MSQAASVIIAVILLLSPIAFVLTTVLWRKSVKREKSAQNYLFEAGAEKLAAIEKVKEEANREVERFISRLPGLPGLFDLDVEKEKVTQDIAHLEEKFVRLKSDYREKKSIYDRLESEIAIFDERLSFAELGVYEPHFDFGDSEAYKIAISAVRDSQKRMISDKSAVFCNTNWSVDGSQTKGQTMTNRNIRLTLRAFNNESDVAIANTRWNNVNAMEKRILRAKQQIDKANASNAIIISEDYLNLKLQELYLTHEFREKQKIEREERAERKRLAREEQRLLKDVEEANAQEDRYSRLLAQAKAEAESVVGPQLAALSRQIDALERDLQVAKEKAARAQAMAERTRSGYVYVISNVGSFGEGIVKIGLTRRLDPMDRVRELGDASVPFVFDTHAIIYSDDAPALERALHAEFESTRVNIQNYRKEFFRAELADVEEAIRELVPEAAFFKDVEAQEYRETLWRREQSLRDDIDAVEKFPAELGD